MSVILSVRQLTEQIKQHVEGNFPYVWVRGEVTNVSRPTSGHVYFALKDQFALLQCVWFKGNQKEQERFDPLTGEVFENGPRISLAQKLGNGQQLICAGRLTVYAPRGGYQMVVDLAQESGAGQLHLDLEALRRKLEQKGYFRLERKRPLPEHPMRVAIITAPTGAAIRDFVRLSGERGTGVSLRIHPVPVQGEDAAPRIAQAIREENREGWAEVVVLIRGGGSLEDLWCFNDERVADAVFESQLPVVAGIGHEVDTCLADMTADVRAATPSHAAQILWPERQWYAQLLDDLDTRLSEVINRRLVEKAKQLREAIRALGWLSPQAQTERLEERLREYQQRLKTAVVRRLVDEKQHLDHLESGVRRSLSLQDIIVREEQALSLLQRLQRGQKLLLIRQIQPLQLVETRLKDCLPRLLEHHAHRLERLTLQLHAFDPERPLKGGYALALTPQKKVVRSVDQIRQGDDLTIRVQDGEMDTKVTAIRFTGDQQ